MKKLSAVFVAFMIAVSGVCTPVFAVPSVDQIQQLVDEQPQSQDPRVLNAQEAFTIASMQYSMDKMYGELTDNEKKIDKIFEAKDLSSSLEQSVSEAIPAETLENISSLEEMQELLQEDPALQEKLMQAYLKNKYIKQLIPLFWANQNAYKVKDVDKNTFDQLVIAYVSLTVAIQQQMQQLQEMLEQEEE